VLPLLVVAAVVGLAPRVKRSLENSLFRRSLETTTVMQVSPIQARVDLTATGYVIPQVLAKVGSKVSGRIVKVNLKEGDQVRTGQVLFERIPSTAGEWASAQARVAAAVAKARRQGQAAELELQLAATKSWWRWVPLLLRLRRLEARVMHSANRRRPKKRDTRVRAEPTSLRVS
jgi:multidrug efflux pump subunit AcrA (membrane-fusion protein)